jgi:hypothetical protein
MLEITYAWYGSKNGLSGANRTKVVQALFLSGKKTFTANNMTFGDPDPDIEKKLWITYKIDGSERTATFAENDLVSFTSLS